MKRNPELGSITWGYALIVLAFFALASTLMFPYAPVSVAQEATRPAPPPTRPGTGTERATPEPTAAPPEPTLIPEPTGTPEPGGPAVSTPTPGPVVMPVSGGGGVIAGLGLLLVGLVFALAGFSITVIRQREKDHE